MEHRGRVYFKRSPLVKVLSIGGMLAILWAVYAIATHPISWLSGIILGLIVILTLWIVASLPIYLEEHEDRWVVGMLLRRKTLKKSEYTAAPCEPKILDGAIRICASGGMGGFVGYFWAPKMGSFLGYIANEKAPMMVFRKKNGKGTIVVNSETK
ncbi:hypothetical protein [Porphyromonas sp.]|uniref:hypothetical protein n=1 Tax=Porphyromonas sp. TaxID=1924944 RepID=UPI0026DB5914|nr:hypothetical protein [Porphyromonas sp.]MDO4771597.1 hypothetical protein [Porphyromonas sp.]